MIGGPSLEPQGGQKGRNRNDRKTGNCEQIQSESGAATSTGLLDLRTQPGLEGQGGRGDSRW